MKKLALVVAMFVLFSSITFAQLKLTAKSAGILSTITYDENFKPVSSTNFRGAGEIKMEGGFVDVYGRAIYSSDGGFGGLWAQKEIEDGRVIKIGLFARPITLNRPSPVSGSAQFEPPALSVIPGSATGILMCEKLSSNLQVMGGMYYDPARKEPELNLGIFAKVFELDTKLGVFTKSSNEGIAATIGNENFTLAGFYESKEKSSLFCEIRTKNFGAPYVSMVYNHLKHETSTGIGWTMSANLDYGLTGLLGCEYGPEERVGRFFVWIYLN